MLSIVKDPDAELDYGFDWSRWLEDGESITASTLSITPSGATDDLEVMTSPAPVNTGQVVTVWVEGGSPGTDYYLTNSIVTSEGRQDDRSIRIPIKER